MHTWATRMAMELFFFAALPSPWSAVVVKTARSSRHSARICTQAGPRREKTDGPTHTRAERKGGTHVSDSSHSTKAFEVLTTY
jgi:hypothetical protein